MEFSNNNASKSISKKKFWLNLCKFFGKGFLIGRWEFKFTWKF